MTKRAFLKTLAGRIILIGIAIRIIDFLLGLGLGQLPSPFAVVDVLAALGVAGGGIYFLIQGIGVVNRRLLWRVRHKLIISYFFVGFVPTLLVVAFFLLGGVLLFDNFSAYMVRVEFRSMSERARSIAHNVALEIERGTDRDALDTLQRQETQASREFPGVSVALVPAGRACAAVRGGLAVTGISTPALAGPWSHVEPPAALPEWITCDGFAGLLLYARPQPDGGTALNFFVRAVAFPESTNPGHAVVVDLDVNAGLKRELRRVLGIQLENVTVTETELARAKPLPGRALETVDADAENVPPLPSFAFLEYRDWSTGAPGRLTLFIRLGIPEIYSKISAAPGSGSNVNLVIALLEFVGGVVLVVEIVALVMGLTLARSITGSVHELFAGTEQVRRGDFTHKIAVTADDQLGELAQSFNSMTASIEDLLIQAAEKKRLEEELRIAHEIQMSLLPQGPLRMRGVSVAALCVPAREVGGDYYDLLPLDDHRVGVLIADVSGKGTSAALYMAELKGLMLSLSRIYASPRELLITANRIIAAHLDARSFITVAYAVIDREARTMTYARAGHTPLIYLPASSDPAERGARILVPSGMVVGLKLDKGEMFERLLEEVTFSLQKDDLFVLFTDGITEAMTRDDDFFGEDRLARILEEHRDLPLEELRERVFREVAAFVGGAPQHDDMTMILLRVDDGTVES